MSQIPEYDRGFRDGVKRAVTWLHNEAEEMNDPHAAALYRRAAYQLGTEESLKRKRKRYNRDVQLEEMQRRWQGADQ